MIDKYKKNISESGNIFKNSSNKVVPYESVKDTKKLGNMPNLNTLQTKNNYILTKIPYKGNISCHTQQTDKFNPGPQTQFIQNSQNIIEGKIYHNLQVRQYPDILQRQYQFKTQLPSQNSKFFSSNLPSTQCSASTWHHMSPINPYSPSYKYEIKLPNFSQRKSPELLESKKSCQSKNQMQELNSFPNSESTQLIHSDNLTQEFSPIKIENSKNELFDHSKSEINLDIYNQSTLNNSSFCPQKHKS